MSLIRVYITPRWWINELQPNMACEGRERSIRLIGMDVKKISRRIEKKRRRLSLNIKYFDLVDRLGF